MTFHLPTFLFQATNFIVLVVILYRLLWKPLLEHMNKRALGIKESRDAISMAREQVEVDRIELERKQDAVRQIEADMQRRVEVEAKNRRSEIMKQARQDAQLERERILTQARLELERIQDEYAESVIPILGRVLASMFRELGGVTLHAQACEKFAEKLGEISDARLEELREGAGSVEIRLTSFDEIPGPVRNAIVSIIPECATVQSTVSPELLGGICLRVGETVLDGSIRAQLVDLIRKASEAGVSDQVHPAAMQV